MRALFLALLLAFAPVVAPAQGLLRGVGGAGGGASGPETYDPTSVDPFYAQLDVTNLILTSKAAGFGAGTATTRNAASADGAYYCEQNATSNPSPYVLAFGVTNTKVGTGNLLNAALSGTGAVTDTSSGYVQRNGSTITTITKWTTGDPIGELLVITGGVRTLTFYIKVAGVMTAQTPIADANLPTGPLYCAASVNAGATGNVVTGNFTGPFAIGTPPAGATPWP